MFRRFLSTNDDSSTIFLRFALGIVMLPHGAQKLLGWYGGGGLSATVDGFSSMGVPAVLTVLVILAESLGALGLIFGFLTRLSAIGIAMVMIGAVSMAHWQNGFFMNWGGNQAGEGFEYHILALGLALALAVRGGGRWSVDRALFGRG